MLESFEQSARLLTSSWCQTNIVENVFRNKLSFYLFNTFCDQKLVLKFSISVDLETISSHSLKLLINESSDLKSLKC